MNELKEIRAYLQRKSNEQLKGEALEQAVLAFVQYAEVLYALYKKIKNKED